MSQIFYRFHVYHIIQVRYPLDLSLILMDFLFLTFRTGNYELLALFVSQLHFKVNFPIMILLMLEIVGYLLSSF